MNSPHRERLLGLAVVLAGGMVLLLSGTLLQRSRIESEFHDACSAIAKGDPVASVFATLGLKGFRPGCGIDLPCDELSLPDHEEPIPWFCNEQSCTLIWRRGRDTCFVNLDEASHRASAPGMLREGPF